MREELLYEIVYEEIQRGELRKGLWAKALADADYDDARAKAKYIKLRVKMLRMEFAEQEAHDRSIERARAKAKRDIQILREKEAKEIDRENEKKQIDKEIEKLTASMDELDKREGYLIKYDRRKQFAKEVMFFSCFIISIPFFIFLKNLINYTNSAGIYIFVVILPLSVGVIGYLYAENNFYKDESIELKNIKDKKNRLKYLLEVKSGKRIESIIGDVLTYTGSIFVILVFVIYIVYW